jgi:hypothetical protein
MWPCRFGTALLLCAEKRRQDRIETVNYMFSDSSSYLHDADLVSFFWLEGRNLRLDAGTKGERFTILLVNVSIPRVIDFGMQNVIAQYWSSQEGLMDDKFIRERLDWASSTVDSKSYISEPRALELMGQVRASRIAIVGVVPSVGAELVAVCEHVEISRQKSGV